MHCVKEGRPHLPVRDAWKLFDGGARYVIDDVCMQQGMEYVQRKLMAHIYRS